jgi:valyl-tRNA synthetase
VLSETLTLLHPIIPFITEEIFEQCRSLNNDKSERLITKPYPKIDETLISKKSESEISWIQEFILGVRQIRGEMNIPPGKPLPCFIQNINATDETYIKNNLSLISTLAKLDNIKSLSKDDSAPESAIALVGEMKILIPLAGIVDKEKEILRLNKEIEKLTKHQQQYSVKLNNKKFISGAPKSVIEKEQSKLSSVEQALGDLELQLKKISSL